MPKYKGLLIYQRPDPQALPLFVFAAPASEILSWARILRTADVPGAAQRLENAAHIKSIRSYVAAAAFNIIPTSVTLAVDAGRFKLPGSVPKAAKQSDPIVTELTVQDPRSNKDEDKPAFVIDGQHRLRALSEFDEEMPVLSTIILGASKLERALNFVVINNKAKRVASDLVRAIVAELQGPDQERLKERLVAVGLTLGSYPSALEVLGRNPDSPFCKLIDWDINRDGTKRIKPQALENSLRIILGNLQAPDRLDIDDAVELLSAMWHGVIGAWGRTKPAWSHENSKLVDKAGLVAVTEFLVERLNLKMEEGFDISDPEAVQKFCKGVMSSVPADFWILPWNKKELDTSAGRSLIKQSLIALRTAVASKSEDPLSKVPLLREVEDTD
jgi:DGQHR domain-containing protein